MMQTDKVTLPRSKIPVINFVLINYVYSCVQFLSIKYLYCGVALEELMKANTRNEIKRKTILISIHGAFAVWG